MPKVGDVVVFRCPKDKDVSCIKRVVAVSGDQLSIDGGILKVNGVESNYFRVESEELQPSSFFQGQLYSEKHQSRVTQVAYEAGKEKKSLATMVIPRESFFVIGDNRTLSEDSRDWGAIHQDDLQGRAFLVWLSLANIFDDSVSSNVRWSRVFKSIF